MSTLGEAAPLTVGASCDIETFRVRSEDREEEGTEDEAGDDEILPFDVDEGEIWSSTSISPAAELEPEPRGGPEGD